MHPIHHIIGAVNEMKQNLEIKLEQKARRNKNKEI